MIDRLAGALAYEEIAESRRLQAILICLLFYCFVVFRSWSSQSGLFLSSVDDLNFMPTWPVEHLSLHLLLPARYHFLFVSLLSYLALVGVFFVYSGKYLKQSFLLLLLLIALELFYYLHDLRLIANFFHVHLYLTFFFIFSRQKLFFFRLALWLVYWLAALVKLTPSWLWGEYFNSVPARLPLLPKVPWIVTGACLLLLLVELCSPLCWLSKSKGLRHSSALVLVLFHLYSGVIVGHSYTTLMTPIAVLALYPFDAPLLSDYRSQARHKLMWAFLLFFLGGGLLQYLVPGDVRTTAEGRYHGLFMFDANRRARARIHIALPEKIHDFDIVYDWPQREVLDWTCSIRHSVDGGSASTLRSPVTIDGMVLFNPDYFRRNSSRMFSDPYVFYYYGKRVLERFPAAQVSIRLDQQLDGNAYVFRVLDLDESELAKIHYTPWGRNSWIRVPGQDAPASYRWP